MLFLFGWNLCSPVSPGEGNAQVDLYSQDDLGERVGIAMKRLAVVLGVSLFASFLFFACGGGGSDGGGAGDLQGTWSGWIEDDVGGIVEFSLQIDGDGNIIEVLFDGDPTGDTGHLNEDWDENLFHVMYDSGGSGIMIVDDQFSHATYGDYGALGSSKYYYGAIERGAANLPAYAESEIVAIYPVGGAYVFTNDSGTWNWVGDSITMTVNPDLTFTGTAPEGDFSGSFPSYDSNHGRYAGTFTRIVPQVPMDITAYISPDGEAVGAFAKEAGTVPISLYDFILMGFKK